jgi:hypothetical protein
VKRPLARAGKKAPELIKRREYKDSQGVWFSNFRTLYRATQRKEYE